MTDPVVAAPAEAADESTSLTEDPLVRSVTHVLRYKWFYAGAAAFALMLGVVNPIGSGTGGSFTAAAPASSEKAAAAPAGGETAAASAAPDSSASAAASTFGGDTAAFSGDTTAYGTAPATTGDNSGGSSDTAPSSSPPPSSQPPTYTCPADSGLPAPVAGPAINGVASAQATVGSTSGQTPPDAASSVANGAGCTPGAAAAPAVLSPQVINALLARSLLGFGV